MGQSREAMTQNLAERLCGQAASRDDARVARRLYRKPGVDGVYRLDEGARLDDFFQFWRELGVLDLREGVQGKALQRTLGPMGPYLLLDGLQTLCGIDRMQALPAWLCSDEALMPWVGFKAQQVRYGVCQRGAAKRQRPRPEGPMCPDTLANNIVQLNRRDLEAWYNGTIRALAKAGIFGAQGTGMVEATDLDMTAADEGRGQATRTRKITDTQGKVHEIAVTVYGGKPIVWIDAHTKIPLAVKVVPIHEHEVRSRRALVTQARTHLAGASRLHQVIGERGFLHGVELWWLDQQGITFVVPAQDHMAVTADARAQAAAGEGLTVGRRVHTVRHGQGQPPGGNGGRPRWWASPG